MDLNITLNIAPLPRYTGIYSWPDLVHEFVSSSKGMIVILFPIN